MKNLKIKTAVLELRLGTHIDDAKEEAAEFCISNRCTAYFSHNGQKFIVDKEGNVALLPNAPFDF